MDVLLLIAMLAVGASGLYVAITFNARVNRTIGPRIENAKNSIAKEVRDQAGRTGEDIAQALRAAETERNALRGQLELERGAVRERLERIESKLSEVTTILAPGLEDIGNIRGMTAEVNARQPKLDDNLHQTTEQVARLSDSLARQLSQTERLVTLATGTESLIVRNFSGLTALLREIQSQQSLIDPKLAGISQALGQHVEMSAQAERHDNWTAEQLVIITDRIDALLDGYDQVAGYLRGRLDKEISQANPSLVSRVLSSCLRLSQPTRDIAAGLLASFCKQLSLSILLPPTSDHSESGPYLLWRSTADQRLEDVLSAVLIACADESAKSSPGLDELRSLLVVLHAGGPGTIQLGPMIINRTHGSLLGCVLTDAEISDVGHPGDWSSPSECEERLRELRPHCLVDLTSWADSRTLVREDLEAS